MDTLTAAPAIESISLSIAWLRGQRVILDSDLAALYGVETKRFNEQVKRNLARFPADFMFQLDANEHEALRSQIATSNAEVSIYVVRAFVRLRDAAVQHKDLAERLSSLEEKTEALAMQHDTFSRNTRVQLRQVFDTLRELVTPPEPGKRPIGFVAPQDTKSTKRALNKR